MHKSIASLSQYIHFKYTIEKVITRYKNYIHDQHYLMCMKAKLPSLNRDNVQPVHGTNGCRDAIVLWLNSNNRACWKYLFLLADTPFSFAKKSFLRI